MICEKCNKEIKDMFYIVKRSTSPEGPFEDAKVCTACRNDIKGIRTNKPCSMEEFNEKWQRAINNRAESIRAGKEYCEWLTKVCNVGDLKAYEDYTEAGYLNKINKRTISHD